MIQMRSSEDQSAGDSNPLQDDKADVHGNGNVEQSTIHPSAPPEELLSPTPSVDELNLSVGNAVPFDYGKKLFNQLNELRTAYIDSSTQLCTMYGKTSINDISIEDIKKCNKLQKKDLGEMLLSVLNKCAYLCFDTNLDNLSSFKYDTQFQNLSSELSKCVQDNLEKYSASQDARLKDIEVQINKNCARVSVLQALHFPIPR